MFSLHNSARRKTDRWLLGLFLLSVTIGPPSAALTTTANDALTEAAFDPNADETLLLDVQVNGHPVGKIGEFILRQGRLMVRPEELRSLGFQTPEDRGPAPGPLLDMSDLPGLVYTLDLRNLVLHITAIDSRLIPTRLKPDAAVQEDSRRVVESGTGMTLNYDTVGTFAGGQNGATGSFDLRAFSPRGIVSSEWLAYAGANSGSSGSDTAIRLDSAYTFGDVNTLRRYTAGDFINSGLAWTRPVHMEGFQIESDFSMRPDLITFPLPSVTGSASVPSTVSVLADGNLTVSSQVGAGPFQVPALPVISGAGTISMTVTNALGQQVTVNQPFYASSELLARGLHTFGVQSGLVRREWGAASYAYGKLAGATVYRRGLTDRLTMEASAEATPGAQMAGLGAVVQIGTLGIVNFAGAATGGAGHPGAQFSLGAQRIGRIFSLGGQAIVANSNYRDIASMNGDGIPRKQLSGYTSLSTHHFGAIGAANADLDQDAAPVAIQGNVTPAEHSHVVSGNYSFQVHHIAIYASEFEDLASTGNSSGMQFGVTIPFGRRSSVEISATSDGSGQVQVQKSAALVGQWGYDAYISSGNSNHQFAEMQYKSPVGLFTAGIDESAGLTTLRMESQGAFSWVDGGIFPSNTIYDSFAIVDTNPIGHVEVLQENRDVGKTNSAGRLLVPDMRSFDTNHIAIVPTDVPPDVSLKNAAQIVRPRDLSGVVVRFPLQESHGALLRLVDQTGLPLPLGTSATLKATGVTVPVGYDGDAYVEGLSAHNELAVELPDGRRCTVHFDYKPIAREIPSIGPLSCTETKP